MELIIIFLLKLLKFSGLARHTYRKKVGGFLQNYLRGPSVIQLSKVLCPIYIIDIWESILKDLNILNLFMLFIKEKFCLSLGLGPIFPHICVISFVFVGSLILSIHIFRKHCPNFVLSKGYQCFLTVPIIFTLSIPLLGFSFFFRAFVESKYSTKINTLLGGGGLSLTNVKSTSNGINEYFHPSEYVRMSKCSNVFDSNGNIPKSFANFITRKTVFDFNKADSCSLFFAIDAGKQLVNDRFNMLPFVLKSFPDGFLNQKVFIKKGIPLYDAEKREFVYSKLGTVVKKDDFLELLRPSFFDLISVGKISWEMVYQAMHDSQMQTNIVKYREEYQIGKFLNTLGDNITELEVFIRLMNQQKIFVDMMDFFKPNDRLIDIQNKYNLHDCYQIKNQTFTNSAFDLKYNLNNPNSLNKFCNDLLRAKINKYFTKNQDIKLIFNLEAATFEHAFKIADEVRKQQPDLSKRIFFANPKEYPVCSTEEKTAVINTIKSLTKNVYTYYT